MEKTFMVIVVIALSVIITLLWAMLDEIKK